MSITLPQHQPTKLYVEPVWGRFKPDPAYAPLATAVTIFERHFPPQIPKSRTRLFQ